MIRYCFSLNGEEFFDRSDESGAINLKTRKEAYDAAIDHAIGYEGEVPKSVVTGVKAHYQPLPISQAEIYLEAAQEQAYGDCGEYVEEWPLDASGRDISLLDTMLHAAFLQWMTVTNNHPDFWTVTGEQKHEIAEADRARISKEKGVPLEDADAND